MFGQTHAEVPIKTVDNSVYLGKVLVEFANTLRIVYDPALKAGLCVKIPESLGDVWIMRNA
ncbi:hypothetical protein RGUI_4336 (plasmid) [Rhodovulum sp. P5]|nr:hypothetical protein RGUI_4336 [Rhodovulum sp. P5]